MHLFTGIFLFQATFIVICAPEVVVKDVSLGINNVLWIYASGSYLDQLFRKTTLDLVFKEFHLQDELELKKGRVNKMPLKGCFTV
jgi:hypothetical protein